MPEVNNPVFEVEEIRESMVIKAFQDVDLARYADIHEEMNVINSLIRRERPARVVIDLSPARYLSSVTITALVRIAREAKACRSQVRLSSGCETVVDILETMNLTSMWPHFETVEAAIDDCLTREL